jgi:hypothetical protein
VVLHEGKIPTDGEMELAVKATVSLLEEPTKVIDA